MLPVRLCLLKGVTTVCGATGNGRHLGSLQGPLAGVYCLLSAGWRLEGLCALHVRNRRSGDGRLELPFSTVYSQNSADLPAIDQPTSHPSYCFCLCPPLAGAPALLIMDHHFQCAACLAIRRTQCSSWASGGRSPTFASTRHVQGTIFHTHHPEFLGSVRARRSTLAPRVYRAIFSLVFFGRAFH